MFMKDESSEVCYRLERKECFHHRNKRLHNNIAKITAVLVIFEHPKDCQFLFRFFIL